MDLDRDHKTFPYSKRLCKNRNNYYKIGEKVPMDYESKHNQKWDKKPFWSPPKWFKKMKKRIRKAKIKECLRCEDYDNIPFFKKSDGWDWY